MMAPTTMRRERELGYCLVTSTSNGAWHLERGEYDRVRAAWLKGAEFVDTVGFHGDRMTLCLRGVDSINDMTPAVLESSRLEKLADDADDSLTTAG